MPMIEKELADKLVELRAAISLGRSYTPAADLEAAYQAHLDREMWWRGQMGRMTDIVEAATTGGTDRTGRAVKEDEMTSQGSDA